MPLFGQTVLSTAYFPPVEYFFAVANSGKVLVEGCEYYNKQSWRNRCRIFSTGGAEYLSIPVIKDAHRIPVRDVRIDYDYPWLQQHERAFEAAYNSSAFFEYYRDDLFAVLDRRETFLFDLNCRLMERLLQMLGIRADISFTDEYIKEYPESDFRERIHPKRNGPGLMEEYGCLRPYFQVFGGRTAAVSAEKTIPGIVPGTLFVPNLSVLDLLCAEGPDARSYLDFQNL